MTSKDIVSKTIGLIPAAGRGSRLNWFAPKELFPFDYEKVGGKYFFTPLSRHVFDLMRIAMAEPIFFVISSSKAPLLGYYGDGSQFGTNLAYLVQEKPRGLANVIGMISDFCSANDIVIFGMPDTIMKPRNVFPVLINKLCDVDADVCVGLFRAAHPERFGTVILTGTGEFVTCEDKPLTPKSKWFWGALAFRKRFAEVCKTTRPRNNKEVQVADALNLSKRRGLGIAVHKFSDGAYYDLGTPENVVRYFASRSWNVSSH